MNPKEIRTNRVQAQKPSKHHINVKINCLEVIVSGVSCHLLVVSENIEYLGLTAEM